MIPPLRLGALEIHRVIEQDAALFAARTFFPNLTPELLAENRAWLQPLFLDAEDRLRLCVQSYILRTPHHTIMIDTCVGNHKPRPQRPDWHLQDHDRYERGLATAGFSFADIDFVMCTHLHVDHTGWNTRLQDGSWVPTFPNARYVFAERELAWWTEREKTTPKTCPWITDSVLPIVAAGRADLVRSDYAFDDLVTLLPTPGHTIDHFSVHAGPPGQDAIFTGDMIHSPLQARCPEIGMMSDYDSEQAAQTRRTLFDRFCETLTLFCTAHFPSPSIGRVVRWNDSFDLRPEA